MLPECTRINWQEYLPTELLSLLKIYLNDRHSSHIPKDSMPQWLEHWCIRLYIQYIHPKQCSSTNEDFIVQNHYISLLILHYVTHSHLLTAADASCTDWCGSGRAKTLGRGSFTELCRHIALLVTICQLLHPGRRSGLFLYAMHLNYIVFLCKLWSWLWINHPWSPVHCFSVRQRWGERRTWSNSWPVDDVKNIAISIKAYTYFPTSDKIIFLPNYVSHLLHYVSSIFKITQLPQHCAFTKNITVSNWCC